MIITIFISTIFLRLGCTPNLLMILVLIISLIILMRHNIILIMITYYTDIAARDWLQYIELPDYRPVNPDLPINNTVCTAGHSSQAELQTLPNWDRDNRDCPTEVSRPNEVSRIVCLSARVLRRVITCSFSGSNFIMSSSTRLAAVDPGMCKFQFCIGYYSPFRGSNLVRPLSHPSRNRGIYPPLLRLPEIVTSIRSWTPLLPPSVGGTTNPALSSFISGKRSRQSYHPHNRSCSPPANFLHCLRVLSSCTSPPFTLQKIQSTWWYQILSQILSLSSKQFPLTWSFRRPAY